MFGEQLEEVSDDEPETEPIAAALSSVPASLAVQAELSAAQRAEQGLPVLLSLFEHCIEALTQDWTSEDQEPVLGTRQAAPVFR